MIQLSRVFTYLFQFFTGYNRFAMFLLVSAEKPHESAI